MKRLRPAKRRGPGARTFAAAFRCSLQDQEKVADEEPLVLLKRFSRNPDVEKARVEFESAQKVEERFHKDFDGHDFIGSEIQLCCPCRLYQCFGKIGL